MLVLINDPGTNSETLQRAHFIIGLIGANLGDIDKLSRQMAAIDESTTKAVNTDYLELSAHLSALEADLELAQTKFDQTIEKRRNERNYRGMVRALAACADMLARTKPAIAANYFLRAGRSAAQRKAPETRAWLTLAIKHAGSNQVLVAEAQAQLVRVR